MGTRNSTLVNGNRSSNLRSNSWWFWFWPAMSPTESPKIFERIWNGPPSLGLSPLGLSARLGCSSCKSSSACSSRCNSGPRRPRVGFCFSSFFRCLFVCLVFIFSFFFWGGLFSFCGCLVCLLLFFVLVFVQWIAAGNSRKYCFRFVFTGWFNSLIVEPRLISPVNWYEGASLPNWGN